MNRFSISRSQAQLPRQRDMIAPHVVETACHRIACSLSVKMLKTSVSDLTVKFLSWWDIDCSGDICWDNVNAGTAAWFPLTTSCLKAGRNPARVLGREAPWGRMGVSSPITIERRLEGERRCLQNGVTKSTTCGCAVPPSRRYVQR